jgi:hypothetical protein
MLKKNNQFGELMQAQFTGTSEDVFSDSVTDENNDCINEYTITDTPLSNDTVEDEFYIQNSRIESKIEPI